MIKKRKKLPFASFEDKKIIVKNPKRKNKNGNYTDPDELGKLIYQYNNECLKIETQCILTNQCDKFSGNNCYCDNKLIKVEGELSDKIYELATRISRIPSFAKDRAVESCDLKNDLINIGYSLVCMKLRNMVNGNLSSSFSYMTTVIKNAYKKFLKGEHKYEVLKIKHEKDQE